MKRRIPILLVGLALAIVAYGILRNVFCARRLGNVKEITLNDRMMTQMEFDTCVAEWAKQAESDLLMSHNPDQKRHSAYRKLLAHGWGAAPFVVGRIEAVTHETEAGQSSNESLLYYIGLFEDLSGFDVYMDPVYRKRAFAIDADGSVARQQTALGASDPVPIFIGMANERIIEWWRDEGIKEYERRMGLPPGNGSLR